MKTCNVCQQAKPREAFAIDRSRKDGLQPKCRECQRVIVQRYRSRDHEAIVQTALNRGLVKTCTKCGETKSVSEFFAHKAMQDGFRPDCKSCFQVVRKARYEAKRPEILAKMREYNQGHAEELRVAHHLANQRRRQNPEWVQAQRTRTNAYGKANRSKRLAIQNRRLGRIANAPVNDFTRGQWALLKAAFGNRCAYCGIHSMKLQADHVIPLLHGGSHTARNIVPACGPCNMKKRTGPALPYQVIPIAFIS